MSTTVAGTGGPISFGLQTLAGYYWVLAQNVTTGCSTSMFDCVLIEIDPVLPVSIEIEPSSNPVNAGTPVSFTATPVNEGPNPVYQWMVNGVQMGSNQTVFSYVPMDGDEVKCVLVSNLPCATNNPATSNVVVMEVGGVPLSGNPTGIIPAGAERCFNATQTLTIAGSGNVFRVENGASVTMIAGQNIVYLPGTRVMPGGYMHGYISNQFCGQKSPTIPTLATNEESAPAPVETIAEFTVYPNPTSGMFTVEQKTGDGYDRISVEVYGMRGERVMTGEMTDTRRTSFDASGLPVGLYFVRITAEGRTSLFKLVKTNR